MFFYNPGVFSKVYLILHRHPCYSRQPAGFEAPIIPNIRDRKLWINIDKTYVSLILEFPVRRVHHRTDIELLEMIKVTAVKLVPGLTGKRKTYILETCWAGPTDPFEIILGFQKVESSIWFDNAAATAAKRDKKFIKSAEFQEDNRTPGSEVKFC